MALQAVPDPIKALCAFLRQELSNLVVQTPEGLAKIPPNVPAVFRPDLPKEFDQVMPAACVVCRPAGGYKQFGKTQIPIGDPTIDLVCYGANQDEATTIARAAAIACKQLVTQEWENTLLYSAQVIGGPTPLPDTQVLWPACWISVTLIHGELPLRIGAG